MQHRISHHLDAQTARQVARKAAQSYTTRFAKYSPDVRWASDDEATVSFSAKGMSLTGTLALEPGAIVLDMNVPLLLKPLASMATSVIEQQVQHWIGVAQRGEL